jgi:DMSO/TMAO reductase YedYZ molybdopterin-dependent catalytic subunit
MKNKKEITEEQKRNNFIRRKSILSFSVLIAGFIFAIACWKWLYQQPKSNEMLKPLRAVLNVNEKINNVFFRNTNIAKEYPKEKAVKKVRVNGDIGMGAEFDSKQWKLSIKTNTLNSKDRILTLSLSDIKSLPKHDVIFDFKCIEGWDQVTHWGGARFSDFITKYKLGTHSGNAPDNNHPEDLYKYVGLVTPDSAYYVGIDIKSMMQEQTLLCYEMNENQLPLDQGYPLRLIITVKYGIKSLKRIGYIYFSDSQPPDYWFEHGYDYDAAL